MNDSSPDIFDNREMEQSPTTNVTAPNKEANLNDLIETMRTAMLSSNGDAMKTATKALLALLLTYKGGRCHVVDGETPSAKDAEMMMQVNALLEIQQLLHETNFGSAIISAIQKNRDQMFGSTFPFALLLSITQVPRYRSTATHSLQQIITQIFREREKKSGCMWLQTQLPDDDIVRLKNLLHTLVFLRFSCSKWMVALGSSLVDLGFIFLDKSVTRMCLIGGQLNNNGDAIGKWLLLQCFEKEDEVVCGQIVNRLLNAITTCNAQTKEQTRGLYLIDVIVSLVGAFPMQVYACQKYLLDTVSSITLLNSKSAIPLLHALMPIVCKKANLRDKLMDTIKRDMLSRDTDAPKTAVNAFLIMLRSYKGVRPDISLESSMLGESDMMSQSFPTFSSQILRNVSQMLGGTTSTLIRNYDALCIEAISCLKRCFNLSADVRTVFYKGLADLVDRNELLIEPAIDMLKTHFTSIIEPSNHPIPVRIAAIVNKSDSSGELVRAMTRCLLTFVKSQSRTRQTSTQRDENDDADISSHIQQSQCANWIGMNDRHNQPSSIIVTSGSILSRQSMLMLQSFADRMSTTELEDLGLDKSSDYSSGTIDGTANACLAYVVIALYDALIEYLWWCGNVFKDFGSAEIVIRLVDKHDKLMVVLKEKNVTSVARKEQPPNDNKTTTTTTAARGGGASATGVTNGGLRLTTLNDMINKLCTDANDDRQLCLQMFRQKSNFIDWLFGAIADKLARRRAAHHSALLSTDFKESGSFDVLISMAICLLKFFIGTSTDLVDDMNDTALSSAHKWKTTAIASFGIIIAHFFDVYDSGVKRALVDIVKSIVDKDVAGNPKIVEEKRERTIARFMALLFSKQGGGILPSCLERLAKTAEKAHRPELGKQCCTLIEILRQLVNAFSSTDVDELKLAMNKCVKVVSTLHLGHEEQVSKELWKLYCEVGLKCTYDAEWFNFIAKSAMHIDWAMGTEIPEGMNREILSINEANAESIATVLMHTMQSCMKNVLYVIEQHGRSTTGAVGTADQRMQPVCFVLDKVAHVIAKLLYIHSNHSRMKAPIVVLLTNFFNTLCALVKFFTAKSKKTIIANWESKKLLIKLAGGHVLKIMNETDKCVGLDLDVTRIDTKKRQRYTQALKDETIYKDYVLSREAYHVALLLLSESIDDDELYVVQDEQCEGLLDFRINIAKVRAKIDEQQQEQADDADRSTVSSHQSSGTKRNRRSTPDDCEVSTKKKRKHPVKNE